MLKTKLKKKLPTLKFLGRVKPRNLTELFEPVKTLNFEDNEEDTDDPCKNQWTGKYGERFRKIYIENKKISGKFTFDYKKTLCEVKNEIISKKSITPFISESIEDLKQVIQDSKRKKAGDVCPIQINDPIEINDYLDENETEEEAEDSTTWILLRAICIEDNSGNSSEVNDVQIEKENQLIRPAVEWNVLNEAIIKCQNWLDTMDNQN